MYACACVCVHERMYVLEFGKLICYLLAIYLLLIGHIFIIVSDPHLNLLIFSSIFKHSCTRTLSLASPPSHTQTLIYRYNGKNVAILYF